MEKEEELFLLQGITQFCYLFWRRDKKDDKSKGNPSSRTTYNSATCHMQNPLTLAVLWQTAAVILKQQVKVKILLDRGSQRTYISERTWKFLNLSTEAVEDVNISTFENSQTLSKSIDRLLLVAKTNSHENILIKVLCLRMLCLPILDQVWHF